MDPLPSMNQVYSKVKSVERINTVMRGREQQTGQVAFAVRGGHTWNGKEEKGKLVCTVCKKTGHTADTCFQVVGYPKWWSEKGRGTGGIARGGGRFGGGRGRGGIARVNVVTTQNSSDASNEAEKSGYTGLTNEQWSTLMKLIEDKQGNNSSRLSGKPLSQEWVLDTGATNHMTGFDCLLSNKEHTLSCLIGLLNGGKSVAREKGMVIFDDNFSLKDVLFVPDLRCNLISVSQLIADLDVVMQFANKGCVIQDHTTKNVTGAGELEDELYFFRRKASYQALHLNKDGAEDLWHKRLGHPSNGVLDLFSMIGSKKKDFSACDVCLKAKHCRDVFHSSDNKSNEIFELIHTDLWGPYRHATLCNSYYFLTFVDDFSRGVWVYLLKDKTQVKDTLICFLALISRQFNKQVKVVRSDNGTEFTCLGSEFKQRGIIHQTSCVGTPQQNGRVERKHRHLLNVARSLLFQSSLSTKFWGESILTAAYLINRTPSRLLKGKTPYELLYGKTPVYDNLRVFGCLVFAHKQRRGGDKFESRSRKCLFVGYPFGKKGWSVFDLETEELFVSRDVVFVEDSFPMSCTEIMDCNMEGGMYDNNNFYLCPGLWGYIIPRLQTSFRRSYRSHHKELAGVTYNSWNLVKTTYWFINHILG